MASERATVVCSECGVEETFTKLEDARAALDAHETETGHAVTWQLHGLASGVERAGADAGVCGEACANPDSPLVRRR